MIIYYLTILKYKSSSPYREELTFCKWLTLPVCSIDLLSLCQWRTVLGLIICRWLLMRGFFVDWWSNCLLLALMELYFHLTSSCHWLWTKVLCRLSLSINNHNWFNAMGIIRGLSFYHRACNMFIIDGSFLHLLSSSLYHHGFYFIF